MGAIPVNELTDSLVSRLLEKTRAGELAWRESVRSGEYTVSFPNSSIGIANEKGRLLLRVYNEAGMMIDEILIKKPPIIHQMMDLLHLARRQALRVDETLEQLLKELA